MKLLFVLPSGDTIYGSGRSAAQLARALNLKFDLVVGKSLIHQPDEEKLKESFGSNIGKIHFLWLPNANYYYGKSESFFVRVAAWHKYFMWFWNRGEFKKILRTGDYTAIHLNSMILAPVVRAEYPMILHVREVFEGNRRQRNYIEKKLRKAHGVIYINPSTRAAFDSKDVNEVIIQDPFEMTHLAELDVAGVRKRLDLRVDNVIFAILGRYEDRNGTEFIVNTFHKMKSDRAVLLVVGCVSTEDSKKIERVTEGDPRIRILGEWKDPGPIFAISDYILRGERFFCGFSRTVYEGLYSGCRVIFPGRREEAVDSLQYDTFCDSLIFYPPRDEQALVAVMEQCTEQPVAERHYLSNREEYVSAYLKLLESF